LAGRSTIDEVVSRTSAVAQVIDEQPVPAPASASAQVIGIETGKPA
jgi:hypothetical protein